jgi:hypothetical protein
MTRDLLLGASDATGVLLYLCLLRLVHGQPLRDATGGTRQGSRHDATCIGVAFSFRRVSGMSAEAE